MTNNTIDSKGKTRSENYFIYELIISFFRAICHVANYEFIKVHYWVIGGFVSVDFLYWLLIIHDGMTSIYR